MLTRALIKAPLYYYSCAESGQLEFVACFASGRQSDSQNSVDSVMENEAGGQRAGGDRSKKPQKKTGMKKLLQVVSSGCS